MTRTDRTTLIRRVEELCHRAWPPEVEQELDGWRLRYAAGVTRRANSVWAAESPVGPLQTRLAEVRDFYHSRGLPARFQLTPLSQPTGLDELLTAAGYGPPTGLSLVQTARTEEVVRATASAAGREVGWSPEPTEEWLATYQAGDPLPAPELAAKHGILRRIPGERAFVVVYEDGAPAAAGLGVREEEWLGLFCFATRPEFRRRGAATTMLHFLARWGRERGAESVHLQVLEANTGARGLYERVGFRTLFPYHYRALPGG